jgi:hypothetical protein
MIHSYQSNSGGRTAAQLQDGWHPKHLPIAHARIKAPSGLEPLNVCFSAELVQRERRVIAEPTPS